MIKFDDLASLCRTHRVSEGLRCKPDRQSWRADLNGTPIDPGELDAVVIHGAYHCLDNARTALLSLGLQPRWQIDGIGPYLILPIEVVDLAPTPPEDDAGLHDVIVEAEFEDWVASKHETTDQELAALVSLFRPGNRP